MDELLKEHMIYPGISLFIRHPDACGVTEVYFKTSIKVIRVFEQIGDITSWFAMFLFNFALDQLLNLKEKLKIVKVSCPGIKTKGRIMVNIVDAIYY